MRREPTAEASRPAGRRERQKLDREQRILRAAETLFANHGYAQTAMAAIARRAGLAVGTLYNYFRSKPEIVAALLRRETGETLEAGERVRKQPPADPEAAVLALFDVYVELVLRHDRRQLRELLAAAVAQPEPLARAAFEMDARLVGQLAELLGDLQRRGQLATGLEAGRAALTLYAIYASWLFLYATVDALTPERFREETRAGIATALRGVLPAPTGG